MPALGHHLLFVANPNPMWIFDRETLRFLAVNDAAIALYGWTREEFLSMRIADIRPVEDLPALAGALSRPPPGPGESPWLTGTWRHVTKHGRTLNVDVTVSDVEVDGRPARLVLSRDVTRQVEALHAADQARRQAEASSRSIQEILERVADGFVAIDRDGRYEFVNHRAALLLGRQDPIELVGHRLLDLFPSRASSAFQRACDQAIGTQQPVTVQEDVFEPTARWFETRIYPSETGLSIYFSDVTERHRATRALRASVRDFRELAEQVPAVIYRADLDESSTTQYISPRIADFGYDPEAWRADPDAWLQALHPDDRQSTLDAIGRGLSEAGQVELQYRMRDASGQWHHLRDVARIVRPDDGRAPFLQGVMIDVSDLMQAQASLREAQETQRNLFDQLGDGVLLLDASHRVLDFNRQTERMFGYARNELLGRPMQDLLADRDKHRVEQEMPDLLAGRLDMFEREHRRRDGSTFPAEVSARPLTAGRYVKVVRDISVRRENERRLLATQLELSELTQRLMVQERVTTERVAQALHDQLGQDLAIARLTLDALVADVGPGLVATDRIRCGRLSDALTQAVLKVREMLTELRPPLLKELGLCAALDNELRSRQPEAMAMLLSLDASPAVAALRWPADVEYAAFMIAREALANAIQHARAAHVRVVVDGEPEALSLSVVDDGIGLPPDVDQPRPGHLGLVGMRERALAIGGRLAWHRVASGGTTVTLDWMKYGS